MGYNKQNKASACTTIREIKN